MPDDVGELGWWEAKLWRPDWMGSTRSWAAIDQEDFSTLRGLQGAIERQA